MTGLTLTYDVAANWKVLAENYNECYHCGPVHPELSRLVPSFAGGGRGLDWDAGIPHREGAWTFTMSGTTERAPLPGLDEDERTRHKGELIYPNLMLSASADHVAAFTLRPLAVDRTAVDCRLLFHPSEVEKATFDPSDAGDLWDLVNRQDWAICESVQRGMSSRAYTHGWFAPMEDDSADIRRWLLPRLDPSVELVETTDDEFDYVVVGLGALGSGAAWQLATRGYSVLGLEQFELGHARGASHDTSRILRHSYHTPAYVRLTARGVRRLGAAGGGVGGVPGHRRRRARPVPARLRDQPGRLRRSLAAGGIEFEELDVERDPSALAPVPSARGHARLCSRSAARSSRPPGGPPRCSGSRAPPEPPCSARAPVTRLTDHGTHVVVEAGDTTYTCRGVVVAADAWTNQVLAGLGVEIPLTVTLEQPTYFAPPDPAAYRTSRCGSGWTSRRTTGSPATARTRSRPLRTAAARSSIPTGARRSRTRRCWSGSRRSSARCCPARVRRCGRCAASTRSRPDRDFVMAPVPDHPSVVVGLGSAHGFKFAPTFGRILADLVSTGETGSDVSGFGFDRPGLTDPAYEANWMV